MRAKSVAGAYLEARFYGKRVSSNNILTAGEDVTVQGILWNQDWLPAVANF